MLGAAADGPLVHVARVQRTTFTIPRARVKEGIGILTLVVEAGLAASNGEARRAIANNAISINRVRISDPRYSVGAADFSDDGALKLSFGRKRHVIVRIAR